MMAEELIADEL